MKAKTFFTLAITIACLVGAIFELIDKSWLPFTADIILTVVFSLLSAREIIKENNQRKFYSQIKK